MTKFKNNTLWQAIWLCLGLCFLQITACNKSPVAPAVEPVDLSFDLQMASPESQGIDIVRLAAAYGKAQQVSGLRSLLVVRNAKLIAEAYYDNNDAEGLNHVRSVTKSVISTLIGIAIDKGFIQSTNQALAELLEPVVDVIDEQKGKITIAHLLTMSSGLEWNEVNGPEYGEWISAEDQIHYVLQKPLVAVPGQQFNYNSGAAHLLSVILTRATRMSTLDFADHYLFAPMGITNRRWQQVSGGYYNGGAGLELRARDMAKLGLLFLQKGISGKQEIVSSAWVAEATQMQQRLGFTFSALKNVHYGYLWWLEAGQKSLAFFAWGYGGQFVYCVPDLNLVVVTTSQWQRSAEQANAQEMAVLEVIVNYIVPAVK